jgi:hypothetical protein
MKLLIFVLAWGLIASAAENSEKRIARKPASGEVTCSQKWLEIKPIQDDNVVESPEKNLVDHCDTSKPFSVAHKKDTTEVAKSKQNTPYNVWIVCCTAK